MILIYVTNNKIGDTDDLIKVRAGYAVAKANIRLTAAAATYFAHVKANTLNQKLEPIK